MHACDACTSGPAAQQVFREPAGAVLGAASLSREVYKTRGPPSMRCEFTGGVAARAHA